MRAMWPVLLALLTAAIVPTGCVLWFMNIAMRNERLAMQQRLTDIYRQHLSAVRQGIDAHWAGKQETLNASVKLPAPEAARRLIAAGIVDGVIILDEAGTIIFPISATPPAAGGFDPLLDAAIDWELEHNDYANAACLYGQVAGRAADVHRKAQALQAQARCLARAGQTSAAIHILTDELAGDGFRSALDESGRRLAPNALLRGLQLITPRNADPWQSAAQDLVSRLESHDGPAIPSGQRLLLMRELHALGGPHLATLDAEELAAAYLDAGAPAPATGLHRSRTPGTWTLMPPGGRIVGLLRDTTVTAAHASLRDSLVPPAGTRLVLHEGSPPGDAIEPVLTLPAGDKVPDWRLSLYLNAADPSAAAADRRIALYLWTGGLGIALIATLTLIAGGYVGRQLRLTRLKNDLIATVSHELKTPLASMRALVETLMDGRCADEQQAREYLGLIARENQRLSRLIDNFLTFSRMERNRRTFELSAVNVREVIDLATDAIHERFTSPESQLEIAVADLPAVRGDRDALVTVVLNLLDNAWKYTGDQKRIRIRAFAEAAGICIEVADNGIGLSRRSIKRIFDRFHQVDQTLSRQAGGCGLGLSIVKFIVKAHGGKVNVQSQPGQGSTFRVELPAATKKAEELEAAHAR